MSNCGCILRSLNLDQFVTNVVGSGATVLTLVSTVIHGGDTPLIPIAQVAHPY